MTFGALAFLTIAAQVNLRAQDTGSVVPEDRAFVDFKLPPGSSVKVDGRAWKKERAYEFGPLERGKVYVSYVLVQLPQGDEVNRIILVRGGRRLQIAVSSNASDRPELVIQTGHPNGVSRLAFSFDGRFVITGSGDESVVIWNTETGTQLRRLAIEQSEGSSGSLGSATLYGFELDRSGRTLLTVSKEASLWDVATGRRIRTIRNDILGVHTGTLSPDARLLACGGSESHGGKLGDALHIWECATGKKLRTIDIASIFDVRAAFSEGGQTLVVYPGGKGSLACFDVNSGRKIRDLRGHQGAVRELRVSRDGRRVVTGGDDHKSIVWEISSATPLRTFRGGSAVGIDGQGRRVAAIVDERAVVWDVDSGREVFSVASDFGSSRDIALSTDGRRLLTTGRNNAITLWDIDAAREIRRFHGHTSPANSVALSPDDRSAVAGYEGGTTALWDLATGSLSRAVDDTEDVNSVTFSPDGRALVSGLDNGTAIVRDAVSGRTTHTLEGTGKGGVDFAPDGRTYICGGGLLASIYDARTGGRLQSLPHDRPLRKVHFSHDGKRVITWSGAYDREQRLLVWDPVTGKFLLELSGHGGRIHRLQLTTDGKYVIAAGLSLSQKENKGESVGQVWVWDLASGRQVAAYRRPGENVGLLDVSINGKLMSTTRQKEEDPAAPQTAVVLDLATATVAKELQGYRSPLDFAAFHPNHQSLLTYGSRRGPDSYDPVPGSGELIAWDLTTGKPSRTFPVGNHVVRAMCISPDGGTLATVGNEGQERRLRIWDIASGKPKFVSAPIQENYLLGVQFAPNGRTILSWSSDHVVTLWDAATGRSLRAIKLPDDPSELDISPDGTRLLIGLDSNETLLLEMSTGTIVRKHDGPNGRIHDLAVSPDSRRVLLGAGTYDNSGVATLWDLQGGIKLRDFAPGLSDVASVAWSPDGRWAATGSRDSLRPHGTRPGGRFGAVMVWDAESGARVREFPSFCFEVPITFANNNLVLFANRTNLEVFDVDSGIKRLTTAGHGTESGTAGNTSAEYSPDGKLIVTADSGSSTSGGELVIWEAATGRQLRRFQGHSGGVFDVAFSPDGHRFVSASWDKTAAVWDVDSGTRLFTLPGHRTGTFAVSYSPDGRLIATGSGVYKQAGDVSVWNAATGQKLVTLTQHRNHVGSLAFSTDGRLMLSGDWSGTAILWNTSTWTPVRTIAAHPDTATVRFSPDGRRFVTAGWDGTVKLWTTASGALSKTFLGHTGSVTDVAFSPDGTKIATVSKDHTLIVWDLESAGRLLSIDELSGWVPSVSFRADGRALLTGFDGKAVEWDSKSGRRLRTWETHSDMVRAVAVSPDGQLAASGGDDALVALWDMRNGLLLHLLRGHEASVRGVRFSPDGDRLLTCSLDGTLRIWDVATGDELLRLLTLDGGKDWLALTPDGFFDGSPEGRTKVAFRVGGGLNVVPVDRFFQDFFRPGLLSETWQGRRLVPEVRITRSLPPRLKIVSPQPGDVETAEVTVEVEAADQGSGVANLAIFQNGARVLAPGKSRVEGKTVYRSFTVSLVEGRNQLRITASNSDGSWEAEPAELLLNYERSLARSRLFVVAVGINRYADSNLSLTYAAPDAHAIAQLFQQRGQRLYEQVNVATLLDDQATKSGIHEALKRAAMQTRPQDTLIIFLAGHGSMVGQRYYFVPHELRRKAETLEDDIRRQAVPADAISDDLGAAKALKRVLVFDTCASGGALALASKGRSGFALRGAIERLSRTQGIFTIAAASASEEAKEAKQLGHGVLSYALLAGLKAVDGGPLDGQSIRPSNPEGVVDVLEWFTFASGQVPRLTEKLYGAAQDVQTSGQGSSFPVLPLEDR